MRCVRAIWNSRKPSTKSYRVLWKVPAIGDLRLSIRPVLPDNCEPAGEAVRSSTPSAYSERGVFKCKGGIIGRTIAIDGLTSTMTDVIVRLAHLDGAMQTIRLAPSAPSFTVAAAPSQWNVAVTYLKLGVEHILTGADHLLFVFSLLILVNGWQRLIGTITAFTVAHSITLAAATLGFVNVPGPPVEAVIALSIVFVACEVIHSRRGRIGITERWPWIVAFIFGLLHGLGFAGALNDVGLPQHAIPVALLFFNIGVEIGQLVFIGCAMLAMALVVRIAAFFANRETSFAFEVPAAYVIGILASYWLVERTVGFLT